MLSFCKELCDNYNREVNTMKQTLWTREFTRITAATALGAAGGIISQFALSFLVFDETGSTLAAALVVAIQLIPMVLLPLVVAPMMDRLPRKPFLVWGDLLNGVCYAGAGLFLLHSSFSYIAYLAFSLLVSCLGAFDELAYNSFYPLLLPKGQEERAYTVSAMLYPILKVLMMPLAAVLYGGMAWLSSMRTLGAVGALPDTLGCAMPILVSGFFILYLYNGQRAAQHRGFYKWFFYAFYPGHLLVLGLLRVALLG